MRNKELIEKWGPVLEHTSLPSIKDAHRKAVTAQLLENTETALKEGSSYSPASFLSEAAPVNNTGVAANYDPVLITLVRRAMPNLIAYDIAGVQPMTGPTGLIFAMRSNYANTTAATAEAFYNEADTDFSGTGTHTGSPFPTDFANTSQWGTGTGMATSAAERLGMGGAGDGDFNQMSFSIEKVSVTAKSRALKAEYTTELAQDLKAIHGLDAESELANMLQAELLAEINREVVRTVYNVATVGAAAGTTATAGVFDLDVDANGRWSVEKFKGLMFQIEREANQIAKDTRRGKGNILICSSDVASALQMAGVLDYTPALNSNALNVDDTGNTFAGVLNGRFRVYIDPYAGSNYMVIGYKGSSAFDAGMFYCPYVPLQMVRAVGENSFQSKLGFKTRYGMVANPFAKGATKWTDGDGDSGLTANSNKYYRKVRVTNIL
jgi:Major capsid protein Gp23